MYRLRRFGVVRTATVVAVAYAIAFAIIFVPLALIGLAVAPNGGAAGIVGILVLGLVLVVVYPLFAWVIVAIACLVYNLAARWVGGIEIQVDRLEPPGQPGAGYPYGSAYGPGYGSGYGPGYVQPPPGQTSGQAPWATPGNEPPAGGNPPRPPSAP